MSEHSRDDHVISGSPAERAQQVLARHLCGWITGHAGPPDHFLDDADMLMGDLHREGLRIHEAGLTANAADGYVAVDTNVAA
jgi:hypothetical protein